jgi:hypothetical protein
MSRRRQPALLIKSGSPYLVGVEKHIFHYISRYIKALQRTFKAQTKRGGKHFTVSNGGTTCF